MNLNHTVKVVGSVLLSAVMAGSMMPVTVFAQNNDENPTEKTETVYSVLNSDGSISDTIVSSWLHDEDGINNIKETLNLTDVKNIKSNEKPSKDGNTYTWNAKGNDVYYEGTATKQLPVSVKIRYELDGQEMSAKDMEGKSGHLKLMISFTNNYSEVKNINGKSIVIHPSYLAGGMLNMSTGKFSNVKCESGKIVNDGTNEMLAFANIPGLNETLKSAGLDKVNNQLGISDDVTVEADVNDFDLGSIMVGMTNEIDLASELGDIGSVSELTDGIDQLIEADDQLIDGSKQLYDGTTQLKEQAAPLTGSSDQVRQLSNGAIQLNDGVKALQTGLTAYTNGVDTLAAGSQQLYGIPQGVSQIQNGVSGNLGQGKTNLLDGATALNEGLKQLEAQVNTLTPTELDTMQTQIQGAMATLAGMQKTITDDSATLGDLSNSLNTASNAITTITKYNEDLKSDVGTLKNDVSDLKDQISNKNNEIDEKNNEIKEQIKLINDQINKINQATEDANSNIDTAYTTAVNALNEAKSATDDVEKQEKIQGAIEKLQQNKPSAGSDVLASLIPESFTVSDIDNLDKYVEKVEKDQETISTLVKTLVGTTSSVTSGLKDAQKTLVGENGNGGLKKDLSDAQGTLSKMDALLSQYTDPSTPTVKNVKNFKELVTGLQVAAKKLSAGSEGILGGVQQVNAGLTQLQKKSQAGITQVAEGSKTLSSNSATLNGGASALSDATGTLAGQSGTFNEMADGLDTLGKAFETLNSGAKQLYEGNEQFKSEGLDQLKEKVDLGVGELETLQSVMDEIKAMNKEYASYSGAPEGATVTSRYVFRTKEESSK
jgi:putative membrane protein